MEEPFSDECDENDVYMDDEGNISMKDKKSQPKREARPSSPQPDDQQRRSTFRDTIVGRIPEGLATTSTDEGVERSNFLHGALGTNVWYDRSTNRVFAGRTAEDASAWYNGRTDNQTFDVAGNPVYHAAPRGFPRTIAEFIQLRQLARRDKAHSRDRVEAFLLLSAFTEAASQFALHLRDTVMTFAVNNPVAVPYRLEEQLSDRPANITFDISRLPPPNAQHTYNNWDIPEPSNPISIDEWAFWAALLHNPESRNPLSNVLITYGFEVHRRSLFGHLLLRLSFPIASNSI